MWMVFEFKADVGRDVQPKGLVGLMDLFIIEKIKGMVMLDQAQKVLMGIQFSGWLKGDIVQQVWN